MRSVSEFHKFEQATSKTAYIISLVVLRILLGVQFLTAGLQKVSNWSAEGYLSAATGPFAGMFQSMAGNGLVDVLNVIGQIAIGIALILGLGTRPASFFGAILMALYYLAHFELNTAHGMIEYHIIYIVIFLLFLAGGVGHAAGLDGIASRMLKRQKVLAKILFG